MSTDEGAGWVAVVGWHAMTHSDVTRAPGPLKWVKLQTLLQHDYEVSRLSLASFGLYCRIVLEYAQSGCRLRADTAELSRRVNGRCRQDDLERLVQAGLLRVCASMAHVEHWHGASPRVAREEVERELTKDVREGAKVARGAPDGGAGDDAAAAGTEQRPPGDDLEAVIGRLEAVRGREIPF